MLACFLALQPVSLPGSNQVMRFDPTEFGAKRDGRSLDTEALQAAIDAAHGAGGGTVELPAGTYRCGTLHLKSGVTLQLLKGAVILGSNRLSDYERGNWPALIMANGQRNVAIRGEGVIDGNSSELVKEFDRIKAEASFMEYFPRVKPGQKVSYIGSTGNPTEIDPYEIMASGKMEEHLYHGYTRPNESVRPQIIELRKCEGVIIEGVTLQNAANWVQTYRDCTDMKFHGIKVRSTQYWNNDGLDIVDCQRVRILDVDIDSADDAICLKSEPFGKGCSDIVISRAKLASRASAIKFGTASHIGFKRIHISDIEVRDTYRSALAIQSVDGAEIEDVTVERVKAVNTGNAIFIRLGRRNQAKPAGSIRGIALRDFDVEVPPLPKGYHQESGQPHNLIPSSIVGLPGSIIQDVVLERIRVSYGGQADPSHANVPLDRLDEVPIFEKSYPEFSMWGELPAWALYLRHAQGITFRSVDFRLNGPDFRPAVIADHVEDLDLGDLKIGEGGGTPHVVAKDSPRLKWDGTKFPPGEGVRQIGARGNPGTARVRPGWIDSTRARVYRMADDLVRTLRPWKVPDRTFRITDFGAVGDGSTVNTTAIQSAIEACSRSGGGVVLVEGGEFVTGTIDFRSNVMLEVAEGAKLLGSLNLRDYPDRIPKTFTVMDSNMGLRQSLIFAERCENIGIRGKGVIDGRGTQANFPGPTTIGPVTGRPFLIRVLESRNIFVGGISLQNSAAWVQNYLACENLIIDGISVDSRVNGNNDGIDIDGCRRVIVRNSLVRSGDDALCFKGASMRPTENVLVEGCELTTWCNALKFGTDTQADFRNVLVRDCTLGGNPGGEATTGITWASVDGGIVEDIVCEDLTINRSGSPVFIRRGSRGRTIPGAPRPPVGDVRRLIIDGVTGEGNGSRGSMISGINGYPVRDLLMRNIHLDAGGGGLAEDRQVVVPENPDGYPDAGWFGVKRFPAFGWYVRYAEDVILDDVSTRTRTSDLREFLVKGINCQRLVVLKD